MMKLKNFPLSKPSKFKRKYIKRYNTQVVRKLLILSLDWKRGKDPEIALSHGAICAYLKKEGVFVIPKSYSVINPEFDIDNVVNDILNYNSKETDFAVGAYIWNDAHPQKSHVKTIMKKLKENNWKGRTIIGGPQITFRNNDLKKLYPDADIFIRGDGELPLTKIAKGIPLKDIEGVYDVNDTDRKKKMFTGSWTPSFPLFR